MKVLLIGLGSMGSNHFRVLKLLLKNSKDLLLYDSNKKRLSLFLKKHNVIQERNLDKLIKMADRVIIASNTSSHYKIVIKCIKNGAKIIFVEKPFMKSFDEAKKVNKILKNNKIKIFVGLIERFNSSIVSLRNYLKTKKIYHFEANRTARVPFRNKDINIKVRIVIKTLGLYTDIEKSLCLYPPQINLKTLYVTLSFLNYQKEQPLFQTHRGVE